MGKLIVLGSIWKRAFAHLIDLAATFALASIIYFPFILPNVSNEAKYNENAAKMVSRQLESGLFIDFKGISTDVTSPIEKLEQFHKEDFTYYGETKTVYLLDNLKAFYCSDIAVSFHMAKLSDETFESSILGIGKDSSLFEYLTEVDSHLKINKKENVKEIDAVLSLKDIYSSALSKVNKDPLIVSCNDENTRIVGFTICYAFLPVILSAFIFFYIIPLISKTSATLGKKIFKLTVLDKNGYTYKKRWLILRFLSFLVIEMFGSVFSFGATLLISYTMTMFTKKHRSIHDYLSASCVADEENSLYFDTIEEERRYEERNPSQS